MDQPAPASLTHQHLVAALATEWHRRGGGPGARVLDAGCGEGHLVGFLHRALPAVTGAAGWQVHGFDVADSLSTRSNRPDLPAPTLAHLADVDTDVDWRARIGVVDGGDPWPADDASFPFVVSNQVLEHVADAGHFLRETRRVLAPGGVCINVFPLRHALLEGHLLSPLAAQVQGHEQRAAWLRAVYRVGLGKPAHRALGRAGAAEDADYVQLATHYRSWSQLVALAKRAGLRISYRYTAGLYGQRLRRRAGQPLASGYRVRRNAVGDWAAFVLLRSLASVTIVLERPDERSPFHW